MPSTHVSYPTITGGIILPLVQHRFPYLAFCTGRFFLVGRVHFENITKTLAALSCTQFHRSFQSVNVTQCLGGLLFQLVLNSTITYRPNCWHIRCFHTCIHTNSFKMKSCGIVSPLNIWLPVLIFYSMGAPVMVELEGETDPLQIAMKELKWVHRNKQTNKQTNNNNTVTWKTTCR